jgi:hypothetical protein
MSVLFLVFGVMEITANEIFLRKYVNSTYILHEILLASKHLQTW